MEKPEEDIAARAERHVQQAQDRMHRQEMLIRRMSAAGQNTGEARLVLGRLKDTLARVRKHLGMVYGVG